jgi:hypothetical protein
LVWGFESGFSGFRGFLSVRRWLVWCVLQLKMQKKISIYSYRRCDDRSGEILIQVHISDNHHIKPATSSVILEILKILIQNPCDSIHLRINFTSKPATSSVILEIRDSKPVRQYPSANKLYFQTSDIIINQKNQKNPGSD